MNKKKIRLLAAAVGTVLLVAGFQVYRGMIEDRRKAYALQEVRDFFASFGEIETLYVDEMTSSSTVLHGGVVLADGRLFLFENKGGMIEYQEGSI